MSADLKFVNKQGRCPLRETSLHRTILEPRKESSHVQYGKKDDSPDCNCVFCSRLISSNNKADNYVFNIVASVRTVRTSIIAEFHFLFCAIPCSSFLFFSIQLINCVQNLHLLLFRYYACAELLAYWGSRFRRNLVRLESRGI